MKTTCPLTDEWINKQWYIYIYKGTLFSHEKEYIGISSNEVDELKSLLYKVKQFRKKKTNTVY